MIFFRLPQLTTFVYTTQSNKKDGDKITRGEVLGQLETALFTMDLESYLDGYLYFRPKPGKWLYTDDFICLLLSKPPKTDAGKAQPE